MTAAEELRIIKQVLDGDKSAFEALVLENQKNVYNLALKMTGDEQDALDISQEAFLKAYRQLGGFLGRSRFSVWLYRLTYNLCIDFMRKKPRINTVSLTFPDDGGEINELELPDIRNLPEETAIRRETRKAISEAFNELGDKHREIFIMREITGMSYLEIADVLQISEGTVKSRLARARKGMMSILVKNGTFPAGLRLKGEKEVGEHE